MTIFGTIGVFSRFVPFPSGFVASVRGLVGVVFLVLFCLLTRHKISFRGLKKKLPLLILSGVFIGANWILLFEAYRHTTVASAVLCYYTAPIIVILASPFLFKERLTPTKIVCVLVTVVGVVFVSGVMKEIRFDKITQSFSALFSGDTATAGARFGEAFEALSGGRDNLLGLGLALAAALLYASAVCMNKAIGDVGAYEKTILQLGSAGVVLVPYFLLFETLPATVTVKDVVLLIVLGAVHTGLAYCLYFGSINDLPAQKVALFSYLDPVVAIFLSALVLHEPLGWTGIVGAVLILGSAVAAELIDKKKA